MACNQTIGIKFCGGCNPKYDRREVYDSIIAQFGEACVSLADPSRREDVLCVICGCASKCAAYSEYNYCRIVWIDSAEGLERLLFEIGNTPKG
jgi:ethanolamine utilization protein EutA (predicted chaperonin)